MLGHRVHMSRLPGTQAHKNIFYCISNYKRLVRSHQRHTLEICLRLWCYSRCNEDEISISDPLLY